MHPLFASERHHNEAQYRGTYMSTSSHEHDMSYNGHEGRKGDKGQNAMLQVSDELRLEASADHAI